MRTIIHIEIVDDVDRAIKMLHHVVDAMVAARSGDRLKYNALVRDGAVEITHHGKLDEALVPGRPKNWDPTFGRTWTPW